MARWKVASAEVKVNSKAALDVLNSPGVKSDLISRAERIVNAADATASGKYGWFESDAMHDNRFAVTIYPKGYGSFISNAKHNTLLKALNSGR